MNAGVAAGLLVPVVGMTAYGASLRPDKMGEAPLKIFPAAFNTLAWSMFAGGAAFLGGVAASAMGAHSVARGARVIAATAGALAVGSIAGYVTGHIAAG